MLYSVLRNGLIVKSCVGGTSRNRLRTCGHKSKTRPTEAPSAQDLLQGSGLLALLVVVFQLQQHLNPKLSSWWGFQSSGLSAGRAAQLALSNPGDSWRVSRTICWSRYCQRRSITEPGAHTQISSSEVESGATWAVVTVPWGSL